MKTYFRQLPSDTQENIRHWIDEENIIAPTINKVHPTTTIDLNFEDIYEKDGAVYYPQGYEWTTTDEDGNQYEPTDYFKLATLEDINA